MHNEPREKLRELIVEYGRSLCADPRRCKAFLNDYCGQYKREISVLINALTKRVAEDLLKTSAGVPQILLLERLSTRLEDELAMTAEAAKWAVESWALALDVFEQPLPAIKPISAPPIPPVAIQSPPLKKVSERELLIAPTPLVLTDLADLSVFRDRLRTVVKPVSAAPIPPVPPPGVSVALPIPPVLKPLSVFRNRLRTVVKPVPAPLIPPVLPPGVSMALPMPPVLKPLSVFRDPLRDGSPGPAMIVIPAGEFWMGSPEGEAERFSDEHRHRVTIARPFAIGQYAVTFDEYDHFCANRGRTKPKDHHWVVVTGQ